MISGLKFKINKSKTTSQFEDRSIRQRWGILFLIIGLKLFPTLEFKSKGEQKCIKK
jgi:hypothetical protein